MLETKVMNRWFWPWQDEREEQWLGEQARQGWHLVEPGLFGRYTFTAGPPGEVVYRLDFINVKEKKDEGYWQLFQDAGWKHVGELGGWQYFCKRVKPGETAEIFTDNSSKIAKYQRVLGFLLIFMPVWMSFIITASYPAPSLLRTGIALLMAALILLYSYVLIGIYKRINQLKKS